MKKSSIGSITNSIEGDIICIKIDDINEYNSFIDICIGEGYTSLISSSSHLIKNSDFFNNIYFIFNKNLVIPIIFDETNKKLNVISFEKFKFLLGVNTSKIFIKIYLKYISCFVECEDGFYKYFCCYIDEKNTNPNSIFSRHADNLLGGDKFESYSINSVVNNSEDLKKQFLQWLHQFYDYQIYSFDLIGDYNFFHLHNIDIKKPFVCLSSIFNFHGIKIDDYNYDTKSSEYLKSYISKFKSLKK